MAYFLVKSDPETYGLSELERDGKTVWDGVKNPTAVRHIRSIKKGDKVLIYHTGDEKAVVGLGRAVGDGRPDPKDEKLAVFDLEFLARAQEPVTLKTIKSDADTKDMDLVRIPRLSTMAVSETAFRRICALAGLKA
ncbi:MAG: EVE domain-containing protein [Myxococcota bacterium]